MKDTITPLNYTKEAIKDLSVMEKGLRSNAPLTSYIGVRLENGNFPTLRELS